MTHDLDRLTAVKVRDRARDLAYLVMGTGAQGKLDHRLL